MISKRMVPLLDVGAAAPKHNQQPVLCAELSLANILPVGGWVGAKGQERNGEMHERNGVRHVARCLANGRSE